MAVWIIVGLAALAVMAMAKTINPNSGSPGEGSIQPTPGRIPLRLVAEAIARAEGYYDETSLAYRHNNPGNIYSNGGTVHVRYDSIEQGWNAMEQLLQRYNSGSWIANSVSTWQDVAWMWVNGTQVGGTPSRPGSGDDPDRWLAIVAADIFSKTGIQINPYGEFRNDVAF